MRLRLGHSQSVNTSPLMYRCGQEERADIEGLWLGMALTYAIPDHAGRVSLECSKRVRNSPDEGWSRPIMW
jgi:hypothetical protein